MIHVSSKFLDAVRDSHASYVTCDLWYNNAIVASAMPIVDGSITCDRNQKNRRSGSVVIGDPTFFPTYANSPLAPYGAELNINMGIKYPDGSTEDVSLGWFRIQDVDQEVAPGQSNGALPVVQFYDRSAAVQDNSFLDPIDRGGWDAQKLITHLIQDVTPAQVVFDPSLGTARLPGGTTFDSDRWDAIVQCAGLLNAEVYFDNNGVAQVVPIPSIPANASASSADWVVDASTPAAIAAGANAKGVLVSAKRGVSRTGVYNAVAAYGAQTGTKAGVTGYACDTDTRSPTYFGPNVQGGPKGLFGGSTYRYTNSLLTTTAQCTSAAQAQLSNFLGLARSLDFTACPNPALEAGDILQVIYPDGKWELHLLDAFTIPLGPSSQFTGSTRTLTYQLSGGT